MWKSKRITATTLITLALCIGATTAIFSSVYSLMLKPLPYQEPGRIVELYTSAAKAGLNHMMQEKSRKRLRRLRKNDTVDKAMAMRVRILLPYG